jgi:hypothetical protein
MIIKYIVLSKALNMPIRENLMVLCNLSYIDQAFIALFKGRVYCSLKQKLQFGVA